jgi:hypothetical protein
VSRGGLLGALNVMNATGARTPEPPIDLEEQLRTWEQAAKQWLKRAHAAGHDMSTVCGPSYRQRLGLRLYRLADAMDRKLEQW